MPGSALMASASPGKDVNAGDQGNSKYFGLKAWPRNIHFIERIQRLNQQTEDEDTLQLLMH
jgi:hypothetical protein